MKTCLASLITVASAALVLSAAGQRQVSSASPGDGPFFTDLPSGVRLSISQGPNQYKYVYDGDLFAGYPSPRAGDRVTLRGPVVIEPEAGVCMRQIIANPLLGFLYGCRTAPRTATSNARAVADLVERAAPSRVWMEWEGTVDAIESNGNVLLRDIDRYTVIPFDLGGVTRQAAAAWRQSWDTMAFTVRSQQTPRELLTLRGELDAELLLSSIMQVPDTMEDSAHTVLFDPERQVAEVRWPRITAGHSIVDGREVSLTIERCCFVEVAQPPRVMEIAARLSPVPISRAEAQIPVVRTPPLQPPWTGTPVRALSPAELPLIRTGAVPLARATPATNALMARPIPGNPEGIITARPYPGNPAGIMTVQPVRLTPVSTVPGRLPTLRREADSTE